MGTMLTRSGPRQLLRTTILAMSACAAVCAGGAGRLRSEPHAAGLLAGGGGQVRGQFPSNDWQAAAGGRQQFETATVTRLERRQRLDQSSIKVSLLDLRIRGFSRVKQFSFAPMFERE